MQVAENQRTLGGTVRVENLSKVWIIMVVFSEPCGAHLLYVVRVTPENLVAVREARNHISEESWRLYTAGNPEFNELERIVQESPLRPGDEGTVFFAMILNDKVVGLSNHHYYVSNWGGNYCVAGGLVVLDEYQRRGIGTTYSHISVRMATYMGARFFYGETRVHSPMHLLRKRQGWEMLRAFKRHGERWVEIRLVL